MSDSNDWSPAWRFIGAGNDVMRVVAVDSEGVAVCEYVRTVRQPKASRRQWRVSLSALLSDQLGWRRTVEPWTRGIE